MSAVIHLFLSLSLIPTLTDFNAISLGSFLNCPWQMGGYQITCMGIASSKSNPFSFCLITQLSFFSKPSCYELWLFSGLSLENLLTYSSRFSPSAGFESKAILHWSALFSICSHLLHVFQKFLKILVYWRQLLLCPSDIKIFIISKFKRTKICVLSKLLKDSWISLSCPCFCIYFDLFSPLFLFLYLLYSVLHKKTVMRNLKCCCSEFFLRKISPLFPN